MIGSSVLTLETSCTCRRWALTSSLMRRPLSRWWRAQTLSRTQPCSKLVSRVQSRLSKPFETIWCRRLVRTSCFTNPSTSLYRSSVLAQSCDSWQHWTRRNTIWKTAKYGTQKLSTSRLISCLMTALSFSTSLRVTRSIICDQKLSVDKISWPVSQPTVVSEKLIHTSFLVKLQQFIQNKYTKFKLCAFKQNYEDVKTKKEIFYLSNLI